MNDPVSVPVNPPQNTPSKSGQTINYSASIVPKQTGGKGNRKLQQQQQKNASPNNTPFVIIQPRKNSKNQKNPNGKGPKQPQRQTTPHPFTTLYFNKDRKYDFVNGIMSVNRPTTTFRPVAAAANNKPPLTNIVDGRISNDKTVGHEKSAAKAPKQIKEKTATTKASKATTIGVLAAQIEILDAFHQQQEEQHGVNSNIPKFFQKYEKIQQIYPEFHPYVVQQPKQTASNGGKPSRDGSRNQFFSGDDAANGGDNAGLATAFVSSSQKSSYSQSSSASSAGGAVATKKSSASTNAAQQIRTQNSAFVSSSTKIGKG